jgi:cobalt-zinc-cadmium efflux system membrane fusion protein
VLCDAYEDVLAKVHEGDFAEIRANAFPERVFRGKVGNISRVLDPATRTAKVRIEIANPGGVLRAGMFATASFKSPQPVTRVVIPTSAVVRLHDKDWVFVPEGGNRFRRQTVELGAVLADGRQEVIAGLAPSAKVVENALQFSSASESE